jgi:crotonobetainyl-CoA:carnitine CoA-transferase CaiB-like acyl-CoA transferase
MDNLLDGVRVVEVALYGFVPATGSVLSDWGADVIKVEHPVTGDPIRGLSAYGISPGDGGVTTLWEVFNRGKRCVGIDVGTEQGLELVMELVDEADVFITSFMQPARERLGIDVDQIQARNPRIIYGRGTGHGPIGPDANKGGFDGVSYWSRSGAATASSPPDYDYPVMLPGPGFGDIQSGTHLAGGIAAALFRREKTGRGGVIDVSLLGSGLWAMQASIAGSYATGKENIVQLDRRAPPNPLANMFRSQDSRYFVLGMLESDRYWSGLCEVLDRPELARDPKLDSFKGREDHSGYCVETLDAIFGELPFADIADRLSRQEGQWAAVTLPGDTIRDEQALVNGYIQTVEYPNGARLPLVTAPARLKGSEVNLSPGPAHGEHTDAVLLEMGKTEEELIALKIAGAVL